MSHIPRVLQDLYLKNLAFFKKRNPQIYGIISNIKPDHSKIIVTDSGDIDLTYNGKSIYGGDAIKFAEAEVKEFNKHYSQDIRLQTISAITPNMYSAPRFFHKHLNETTKQMYLSAEKVSPRVLHQGDRHDFVIMCGIGLGMQISELLDKKDVQNLLIIETDYELLTLSCFFTDWEDIYKKQSTEKNKSISLLLMNEQSIDTERGSLWNELIKRAPHFPYNTVSYNHGRNDKYGGMIRKIISDVTMFISLWGFYDDEVNQLNHVLHNINRKIEFIPSKDSFIWNKPVIVCGSGPSLDKRIKQIKSIRENCILLSAGTSLPVLLKNNLQPDFHIEIESDYAVYNSIKSSNSEADLKEITLICAIQCSPYITTLFKKSYAFVKDSMSIGDIIENKEDKLVEPTPTCVNAAISFAFQYKAKSIYLFGTDFGFYNKDEHHSIHAIYNNDKIDGQESKNLKEANQKNINNNFKKDGYLGDCLTTNLYYTTKRRLEMAILINRHKYDFTVYNSSDGLIIDNTTHINKNEIINLKNLNVKNDEHDSFYKHSRKAKDNIKNKLKESLYKDINNICKLLAINIKKMNCDTYSLSSTCWGLSNYISTTFKDECGSNSFFIRGTIWHYMISGYSIAYACEPCKQEAVISIWKDRFIDLLERLPKDLLNSIDKERGSIDEDPNLKRTIKE